MYFTVLKPFRTQFPNSYISLSNILHNMAISSKVLSSFATILLLIIVLQEISICGEARHLRSNKLSNGKAKGSTKNGDAAQMVSSKAVYVDDFRPTTPGHSPGVGHSVHD